MFPIQSEQINEVCGALAKAQGIIKPPQKTRTAKVQMKIEKGGGAYEYKYADLGDIIAVTRPALPDNGLAISQSIDATASRLITVLAHSSGQYIGCTYDLPRGLSAHQFGSILTYARRYSLCALLGIVAEDDDDGLQAQGPTAREAKRARGTSPVQPKQAVNGGTSRMPLPAMPATMTHADVMARLKRAYAPFIKLHPNVDPAALMMERYGAQKAVDMQPQEAWEFLNFVESEIRKGVSV